MSTLEEKLVLCEQVTDCKAFAKIADLMEFPEENSPTLQKVTTTNLGEFKQERPKEETLLQKMPSQVEKDLEAQQDGHDAIIGPRCRKCGWKFKVGNLKKTNINFKIFRTH